VRAIVLGTLLAVVSSAFATGSAQSVATFKSSVDVVPISAVVRDRHGRIVTTLSARDFEVFDKGERRSIVDFQIDRDSPISLAILLDVSGSMRVGPKLAFATDVARQLAFELQDGRDEVGVFTFDAELHEQQPFTLHPLLLRTALESAAPWGTTSLYDAIAETARRLERRRSPRRAIVVLTDGVDTSSHRSAPEVSGLASSIDVPVYVVVTAPPIDRDYSADPAVSASGQHYGDLRDLAFWTGGSLEWATTGNEAGLRAHAILQELRHEYLIAIGSAAAREWRPIEVRVRDPRMNVRARSGYFVGEP
jgi:Ca-activated chloride channel family protein